MGPYSSIVELKKGGFLKSRLLLGDPKHKGLAGNNVLFLRKLKKYWFWKIIVFKIVDKILERHFTCQCNNTTKTSKNVTNKSGCMLIIN